LRTPADGGEHGHQLRIAGEIGLTVGVLRLLVEVEQFLSVTGA
jgi:hypothetical protein